MICVVVFMDDLFGDLIEYSTTESETKIQELQSELQEIQETNPYHIDETLEQNGFVATQDSIYRQYKDDIFLQITRKSGNKFQLEYSWCKQVDDAFKNTTPTQTSKQTIDKSVESKTNKLSKYLIESGLATNEDKDNIKTFLNDTWNLIINTDDDILIILKDENSEYNTSKYSNQNIIIQSASMDNCSMAD